MHVCAWHFGTIKHQLSQIQPDGLGCIIMSYFIRFARRAYYKIALGQVKLDIKSTVLGAINVKNNWYLVRQNNSDRAIALVQELQA